MKCFLNHSCCYCYDWGVVILRVAEVADERVSCRGGRNSRERQARFNFTPAYFPHSTTIRLHIFSSNRIKSNQIKPKKKTRKKKHLIQKLRLFLPPNTNRSPYSSLIKNRKLCLLRIFLPPFSYPRPCFSTLPYLPQPSSRPRTSFGAAPHPSFQIGYVVFLLPVHPEQRSEPSE